MSVHYVKVALDSTLGESNFASEIIWRYRRWPAKTDNFQRVHDTLLLYVKDPRCCRWNQLYEPPADSTLKAFGTAKQSAVVVDGRRVKSKKLEVESPGVPMGDVWDIGIIAPQSRERTGDGCRCKLKDQKCQDLKEVAELHPMAMSRSVRMEFIDSRISSNGNESADRSNQDFKSTISTATSRTTQSKISRSSIRRPTNDYTLDVNCETPLGGNCAKSAIRGSQSQLKTGTSQKELNNHIFRGAENVISERSFNESSENALRICRNCGKYILTYPTQKPKKLLARLIAATTNEGDLVIDPYCGSGTTCVTAFEMGRDSIGIDQNPQAISITSKRILEVMRHRAT